MIKAALTKYPAADAVGVDIDKKRILQLRRTCPTWFVGRCDITCQRSLRQSLPVKHILGKKTLVLLNPPFSCKGGTTVTCTIAGRRITMGRALSFVVLVLDLISKNSQIVCILPAGSLTSDKDSEAWKFLRANYCVRSFRRLDRNTFEGCSPKALIVRITKRSPCKTGPAAIQSRCLARGVRTINVRVVRGRVPVYKALKKGQAKAGLPLVHSTCLQTEVSLNGLVAIHPSSTISGPAVLLPRVGQVKAQKICEYREKFSVVLSDCVIALCCASYKDVVEVKKRILSHWQQFAKLYSGTCAHYLTVESLKTFLWQVNCRP